MPAKSIKHALVEAANEKGLYPTAEQVERILKELRDYAAHRTMALGMHASAIDLFNDLFDDIKAFTERIGK